MTPDDINRVLATKVMGWREETSPDPRRTNWKGSPGSLETNPAARLIGMYWDPWTRFEHSMMCLETFPSWEIYKHYNGMYLVIISPDEINENVSSDWQPTKEQAICLAALRAKEEA
jgi:hypothetical protein